MLHLAITVSHDSLRIQNELNLDLILWQRWQRRAGSDLMTQVNFSSLETYINIYV